MALFLQFVVAKWYLFAAVVGVLLLLLRHQSAKAAPGLSPAQLTRLVNQNGALLLDIRDNGDFREGHIVDSMNIAASKIGERLPELEKHRERPVVVVCKMGHQAGTVANMLKDKGFPEVYRLQGGITEWQAANLPLLRS